MGFTFEDRHYTHEQMLNLPTRQLLKELRWTYKLVCPGGWACDGQCSNLWCTQVKNYQTELKGVLATREHIPSKQESRANRIARKKRGK